MNFIALAKEETTKLIRDAYCLAVKDGALPEAGEDLAFPVEIPKDTAHGDYTSTFPMAAAKKLHLAPRKIADEIVNRISLSGSFFDSVEIAGAGFINFRLGSKWYGDVIEAVEREGRDFARTQDLVGKKIMVEFVSANPTGPMHMGNARGGVLGDCLSEILSLAGADVTREFLINDAGNQVEKFGVSLETRYLQLYPEYKDLEFPEDGYHGEDIIELAKRFQAEYGDKYLNADQEERREALIRFGLGNNIPAMKRDLARYGIEYDNWFSETTLHDSGAVARIVDFLTEKGHTYEKDGAIWLRTTDFGCEKDDVLRRANGFYTYFAVDIAYHYNKFIERGFDTVINVWGADHHGHVARLKAACSAFGVDPDRLEIILMQLVRLMQNGEVVRMSKRTGKTISLSNLLDEISVDAARFFFNMRAAETQMEFDLDLAVRQDSENPVYYVQYAHARICSLIKTLAKDGAQIKAAKDLDLSLLTQPEEKALIKRIAELPNEISMAARDRDPSRMNKYLIDIAGEFHRYYNACRIRGEEEALLGARLKLAAVTRDILAVGMSIIGVTAPETM
ncbi:MAG: arginine--tRNA ligase [Oscillospiraceae bacterium]|nr:arginine--tRNA ligase [Oscillospiraceae bacterium]